MTNAILDKNRVQTDLLLVKLGSVFFIILISFFLFVLKPSSTFELLAYFLVLIPYVFYIFRILQTFIKSTNIQYTCKFKKSIGLKNYFTKRTKEIQFDELDGYVTGRIKEGGLWKVVWIVKDSKMIERIDERYTKNYNELEEEIKEMKYLGYQKIRLWKRFKMLFGPIKID